MMALLAMIGPLWTWFIPIFTGAFRRFMVFASEPANLVIAALLMAVAFGYGHHEGKLKERHAWQVKIEYERAAQSKVVGATDAKAIKDVQDLETELEKTNVTITELKAKAAADANASRVCLGTNSLRRLNRNRPSRP